MRQIRWQWHVRNAALLIYFDYENMPLTGEVITELRAYYDHEGD